MADKEEQEKKSGSAAAFLFGRKQIFTSIKELTAENVVGEINSALPYHIENLLSEEYLYWYRRGIHPILNRVKQVRPEICNKIVENHADEIVSFKNGYFLTQPAFYVTRTEGVQKGRDVAKLNDYLYLSGKQQADNEIVDWFHTVGLGVAYIEPQDDQDTPVAVYSLDPRSAFVVYSLSPGNKPVYAVNTAVDGETLYIDVYTREKYFKLIGTVTGKTTTAYPEGYTCTATSVKEEMENPLGEIPIIEYRYSSINVGAFETVLPLLDAIDLVQSNRLDGIEQFIQSLLIFYNCELGTDEKGKQITASYVREAGALFLKSIGENKADLKEISSQLDQTQTQVLVDDLYEKILTICGMPSTTKGGKSTSDTGTAVLARDGWYQADTFARNTEDHFRKSNKQFDKVFLKILQEKGLVSKKLKRTDFDLQFTRNETANAQSKAQAFSTMISSGIAPELAAAKSGISNDPVADIAKSMKWIKMIFGDPDKVEKENKTGEGEAKIIQQDNSTGNNETGGAV